MANEITLAIRHQMNDIGLQIDTLKRNIDATSDAHVMQGYLSEIVDLRDSFETMKTIAEATEGVGHEIIRDLGALNQRIETLEAQQFSLSLPQAPIQQRFQAPASLQDRVQAATNDDIFYAQIDELHRAKSDMLRVLVGQKGLNLHEAATEIETTLLGRILPLHRGATPEQRNEIKGFFLDTEALHCKYFENQFVYFTDSITEDNCANFHALLPLIGPLHNFSNRRFLSEENRQNIAGILENANVLLNAYIDTQRMVENDSNGALRRQIELKHALLDGMERNDANALKQILPQVDPTIRETLYTTINELMETANRLNSLQRPLRPISPGAREAMNNGQRSLTAVLPLDANLARLVKEICRNAIHTVFPPDYQQDSAADQMQMAFDAVKESLQENNPPAHVQQTEDVEGDAELARSLALEEQWNVAAPQPMNEQPVDLLTGIEMPQYTQGAVEEVVDLLAGMSIGHLPTVAAMPVNQNSRDILEHKLLVADLLRDLQYANVSQYGYQGAAGALRDLDPETMGLIDQMYARRPAGYDEKSIRTDVINRAFVLNLLSGIQEAIRCDDIENVRNQLDRLQGIRLDARMLGLNSHAQAPGYNGQADLAQVIYNYVNEFHQTAEFFEAASGNHYDFGRVAMRDEEGFSTQPDVKEAVIQRLEADLKALWTIN